MKQPLKGLTVIELATVLAGPSVGMFFAELGARVIKVENPNNPDITRSWRLSQESNKVSAYFSSVNYEKEYTQLDLTSSADRKQLDSLMEGADILLTNFKFGGASKFGLDFERLHRAYPSLIVGQISGFKSHPKRTAFDVVVQAETGWMHMNGTPNTNPVKMPVALMDVLAAHHLKEGLLLALLEREKTELGQFVEVTLEEAGIASLVNQASNYLMADHIPQAMGSQHPNIAPYGDTFYCSDQKAIVLAIGSNKQFTKLLNLLGAHDDEALHAFDTNQKRVANRESLINFLTPFFQKFKRDELLETLINNGLPAGAIRSMDEVFENPVAQSMVLSEEIKGQKTLRVKSVAVTFNTGSK